MGTIAAHGNDISTGRILDITMTRRETVSIARKNAMQTGLTAEEWNAVETIVVGGRPEFAQPMQKK